MLSILSSWSSIGQNTLMKTNKILTSVRRVGRARKGAALVSVVGTMVVVGVVGASVVSLTSSSTQGHLTANAGSRAYYIAESGLNFAQAVYQDEGWQHGRERTMTLEGGEAVDVVRLSETFWATSTVDQGTPKEARARVPMPVGLTALPPLVPGDPLPWQTPVINDGFVILGDEDLTVTSSMTVEGNVAIINDRNVTIYGDVEGDVLSRDITLGNRYADVVGDVYASDDVRVDYGRISGDVHANDVIDLQTPYTEVTDGWLFSNGNIYVRGRAQVRGHIHSFEGDVNLSSFSLIGTSSVPVEIRATGNITINGAACVYGDIYAGGNISGNGYIIGDAYAGGSINLTGSHTGDKHPNSTSYLKEPIAPNLSRLDGLELPAPKSFSPGGSDVFIGYYAAVTVPPGAYRNMYSGWNAGGACVYLRTATNGDGNYYLDSVDLGRNMNLFLDLSGSHDIRIFVKNNIEVSRDMNTYVSTDGHYYRLMTSSALDPALARRVHWESHCDFIIDRNKWFGSVFTPYGVTKVDSSSQMIGSYYSGGGHNLKGGTATYQKSNHLTGN